MMEQPGRNAADAAGDALACEVTALLDVEPSAAFAARVRTRVHAEREARRAWWTRPTLIAACAAAVVVLAVAIGLERGGAGVAENGRGVPSSTGARVTSLPRESVPIAQVQAGTSGGAHLPAVAAAPGAPTRANVTAVTAPTNTSARATSRAAGARRPPAAAAVRVVTPDDAAAFRLLLQRLSDGTIAGPDRLPSVLAENGQASLEVTPAAAPLNVPPIDIAPLAIASAAGDTE